MKKYATRVLLLLVILFSLIHYFRPISFFERTLIAVAYPFLKIGHGITYPIKRKIKRITTLWNLEHNHAELQTKYTNLKAQHIRLQALHNYLDRSKDIAHFEYGYPRDQMILAQILVANNSTAGHFAIIDRGSDHGITKGSIALHFANVLGIITQVFAHSSILEFVTSHKSRIPAIAPRTNQLGICVGNDTIKAGTLRYLQPAHPKGLQIGDLISTSGRGAKTPEGFALGTISSINPPDIAHPNEWSIEIDFAMNVTQIDFCHIIPQETIDFQ